VPDLTPEPIAVTLEVARVFEELGIRYAVAGSMASSLHGRPRSTDDVDIVAEVRDEHVTALVEAWQAGYYADAAMIRDAIARGSSFNIIHLATMLKVDVFVAGRDAMSQEELARARPRRVGDGDAEQLVLASAEDTVLQKLRWYRLGGHVSDRQWADVLGVLQVAGPTIDREYLHRWAPSLGVEDLLARAITEADRERS
jgi:hypothetical protein